MRIIIALILTMMVSSCIAQNGITLDMMEESPDPGMIIVTGDGSVWPIEGVQRYAYFRDHHFIDTFYYKTDSICISLNGDSIPDVCTYVPINSVPVGDTVYFWIFSINGGAPDTITIGEGIDLNAGTRITITGGTDNPTINADSCLQRLEQLTDSTFQITDCAGSPLDTILIPGSGGGGGTITLPKSRFVFTDPVTGELTTDGIWSDSLLLFNGTTRYGYFDDGGNVSLGRLVGAGGTYNIRLGEQAGYRGQGSLNVYIGLSSGYLSALDTLQGNVGIGNSSANNAIGDFNVYIGRNSGRSNVGDNNTYIGDQAGYYSLGTPSVSSDNNLTMGTQAGRDAEGDNNVYLGNQSGLETVGDNNIFIGRINDLNGSYSERLAIGDSSDIFIDGDMSTDSLTVNSTLTVRDVPALANPDSVYVLGPGRELNSYPISGLQTAPDSLEYRGDSIAIIGSNALRIFDLIDTTGWGVDIDTDSQSLSIVDHTLSISRGNSVVLPDTVAPSQTLSIDADTITLSDGGGSVVIQHPPSSDTVKLKPFHEVWTNSDSTLTVNAGFDTLVTYNDSIRWKLLDNRIDAIALGKGARSDHYNSTALGARAFPYLQDTLVHPFNSTQVDTANEWIDGLGSFISHLNDLGYQTGDIVVIKWSLTSGEMPFIDTAQDLRVAEGIHAFTITSPSLLSPVQFGFDSVPTGAYTLRANQYLTGSTAIGHDAVVDKANQIALGDSTSQELKLGDSIRMKIDTAYTHFQLVGFDSTYNQLIPIDAAAFGFTPDADFWELEVDASPGSITDNTYTLGQTVFAADTSVNDFYMQVVPPNGNAINVRDPYSDDVEILWSGDTYSWAWRQLDDFFYLVDGGNPGTGTGVYISAINGYDDPDPILELQDDGGMQWSNYGIGSPRNGGSDFYAIPFVDGGGGVYQLRPDDFLDSLDLSDVGDSLATAFTNNHILRGDGTRGGQADGELSFDGSSNSFRIDNGAEGTSYFELIDNISQVASINKVVASSYGLMDISVIPSDGSGSAGIRFNRNTNSTGNSYIEVLYGDNTANQGARISGNANDSWIARYGDLAVGHNAPSATLHVDGDVLIETSTTEDIQIEIDGTVRAHWEGSNGYLGINTTSPARRFHVNGAQRWTNLGSVESITWVPYLDSNRDVGQITPDNLEAAMGGPFAANSEIYWEVLSGQVITKDNRPVRINSGAADYSGTVDPGTEYAVLAYFDNAGNDEVRWKTITGTGIATITGSGSTINVQAIEVDGSTSNELQNLSIGTRTSSTYPINISSGSGTSLGVFTTSLAGLAPSSGGGTTNFLRADGTWAAPPGGGGDGIYGGSDNLTAGTTTATILSGSVFNFQYNTGDSEFTISGTGTFLRSNPSGASNAVELDADGVSIEAASGDQIDFNVAGGTNEIVIDGTDVFINDGLLIGGNTSNQLRVGSDGSAATMGHKVTFSGSFAQFQSDGDILIQADDGAGDDIYLTADDDIIYVADRMYSANGDLNLGTGVVKLGTVLGHTGGSHIILSDGVAPTSSVLNSVHLYANGSDAELIVRDELGNTTTLSPHNFSKIPEGPSEEMAWAYYSERDGKYINVDMLKLARLVEELTGEKLVYTNAE